MNGDLTTPDVLLYASQLATQRTLSNSRSRQLDHEKQRISVTLRSARRAVMLRSGTRKSGRDV
jgi:hypothetical protein